MSKARKQLRKRFMESWYDYIRPSYRWLWRTILPNLVEMFWYKPKAGIRNVYRWLPVIWDDSDWQWEDLARVMEYKLRSMAVAFEDGMCLNSPKKAQEMLVVAELLSRLQNQEYVHHWDKEKQDLVKHYDYFTGKDLNLMLTREHDMMHRDLEYATHVINKKLFTWWD